jgi:hypothetical protein
VGEKKNAYRIFADAEVKRPPYEAGHGIRIYLIELGVEDVD